MICTEAHMIATGLTIVSRRLTCCVLRLLTVRFIADRDRQRSAAGPSGRLPRLVRRVPSQGPECLGEIDCEPSLRAHPDEHVLRVFVCVSCLLDMVVISM
jgi:hypothetical protein